MSKTEMIRARIEPNLKQDVESIFKKLGLTTTEAISLFYHQVKLWKGLPFEVRIPNPTTIQTFKDTDAGLNLVNCENEEEMFNKMGV
jgi:DNA-damage-inducible protein J